MKRNAGIVGAAVGIACFLGVGLLPSLVYGGYTGVLLAAGIFGEPLSATFAVRALIVFGSVLGVCSVAGLFAVTGAAIGSAAGLLIERTTPDEKRLSE